MPLCGLGTMAAVNPKPRDLDAVVLKVDGDTMRLRREDEATVVGEEMEHTRFIVCCAVGVRVLQLPSCCSFC